MSDIYVTSNNAESAKKAINRTSDFKPINDSMIADDAAISFSKIKQSVIRLPIPLGAGAFVNFTVRHGLDAVPKFVSMCPYGSAETPWYVVKMEKDVVIIAVLDSAINTFNFLVKVEA